jgi:hypothetical protein
MPSRRTYDYQMSSDSGLRRRAGRAHEDPDEMTVPATMTRMAGYVAQVLKRNPDLTAQQAARGAYLLLKADMAKVRAGQSADTLRPAG